MLNLDATAWASLADFWHMGGQGAYVWSAYGLMGAVMLAEAAWVRRQWRRTRLSLAQRQEEGSIDLWASAAPAPQAPAAGGQP